MDTKQFKRVRGRFIRLNEDFLRREGIVGESESVGMTFHIFPIAGERSRSSQMDSGLEHLADLDQKCAVPVERLKFGTPKTVDHVLSLITLGMLARATTSELRLCGNRVGEKTIREVEDMVAAHGLGPRRKIPMGPREKSVILNAPLEKLGYPISHIPVFSPHDGSNRLRMVDDLVKAPREKLLSAAEFVIKTSRHLQFSGLVLMPEEMVYCIDLRMQVYGLSLQA